MTLSFLTQIRGKSNHFVEKIWLGLDYNRHLVDDMISAKALLTECQVRGLYYAIMVKIYPKIHTIRADTKNRWRVGMPIHFVVKNRTTNRFQFAPILPVKAIQSIKIKYTNSNSDYPDVYIDAKRFNVYVKGDLDILGRLAINDGFDSVDDFFKYFNSDFEGKIIHWTDFTYTF